MKQALLLGGALAVMVSVAPFMATADDSNAVGAAQIADATMGGEVDAGKLIGEEVYDANGNKVGEIDSVMVGPKGKVSSVVLDVSGWLESEKLVAVKWTDLKTDPDGKIVSSLTKDSAKAAAAYDYKDKSLRGKVLTEAGQPYAANNAPDDTTAGATATTDTNTADTNTADMTTDNPVVNADGSLNASKLMGLDVRSPEDKKVGEIGEIVLDKEGKAEGIVVDVGGFLGIATHPVLLDWKDVSLTSQDGKSRAVVNLTKDKLEQMPTYETSSK
jgi:sporulation protein YlmC with PRC-barrel domain